MNHYEQQVKKELLLWQKKMQQKPSFLDRKTARAQQKINSYIPEKVHSAITGAIKNMVKAVLFGSMHTTTKPHEYFSLQETEYLVKDQINFYTNTAAAEGGITGLGGILSGLADFPLFLSIKMKMLFEIASIYGYNVSLVSERIYILHIFQLTFSSQEYRRNVFERMRNWDQQNLSHDLENFDWRKFQQEYRDHIDIAKLVQLIPGIGAIVGFVVNRRLTRRLGEYAMNAYRMRKMAV